MKKNKGLYAREQGNINEAARRVFAPAKGELVRDIDRKNLLNQILSLAAGTPGPAQGRIEAYKEKVIHDLYPDQFGTPEHPVTGGDMAGELLVAFAERFYSRGEHNLVWVCLKSCDDARDTAKEREERRELGSALAFDTPCSTKRDRDFGDPDLTFADTIGNWDAPYKDEAIIPTTPLEIACATFVSEVAAGRQGSTKSYRARKFIATFPEEEVKEVLESLQIPDMDVKKRSAGK